MPLEIAARALFAASVAATALPGPPVLFPSWPAHQVPAHQVRPCRGRELRTPIAFFGA